MPDPKKPTSAPGALPYGDLALQGDEYVENAPIWSTLDDLYEGGFKLEKNAQAYLPRMLGEHADRYRDRVKAGSYINYFGQIVDYFVAKLFAQELTVRPAADADNPESVGEEPDDKDEYGIFSRDCDGKGTPLVDLLRELLTTALKKRRALLHVDMPAPPDGTVIENRLQEEAAGLGRVFAYELPLEQVIDWDCDANGEFRYLVIHRTKERKAPPGKRTKDVTEEFKIWEKFEPGEPIDAELGFEPRDGDDTQPTVTWRLHRITYPKNKKPSAKTPVDLVGSGVVSFRQIPVFPFELPAGLWVGNKIGTMAREHYQRRTSLNSAENKSLVAIPFIKKGPEIGGFGAAQPAEVAQNPSRGNDPVSRFQEEGWVEIGAQDELGFAAPDPACYELVDKQIDKLKDEMFRVVYQMAASVSNSASSVHRSGESKKEDRGAEEIVLGALGLKVRGFGVRTFKAISEARREDISWQAHGLDDYTTEDRDALLEEAAELDSIPIPSVTFKRMHKTQVALRLVKNAPPATQDQIAKEIEDGTTVEEGIRVDTRDAKAEADVAEFERSANGEDAAGAAPGFGGGGRGGPARAAKGKGKRPKAARR